MRRAAALLEGVLRAILPPFLAALLLALVLLTATQVGLRYLAGESLLWAEEACIVLLIVMAWAGVSLLWLEDGHVGIEMLPEALAPRPRRWLMLGLDALAVVAGLALAITAEGTVAVYWNLDLTALDLPAAVKYLPVQWGAALLALAAALRAIRR